MRKYRIIAAALCVSLAFGQTTYALPSGGENQTQVDSIGPSEKEKGSGENQGETGQSPSQEGIGGIKDQEQPEIQSEGAVLLDAATGTVLYGKNAYTQFYPASITKLMTGLLAVENCNLDDTVTFSKKATTNLESGSVTLNLTEGDVLTVNDCLHGLLLKSANEVANGLAEKISGSVEAFANKMNTRAKELGCQNTHFVNPNGLNSTQHYTTPYDMALIARAAFSNETLRKINSTLSYKIPATKKESKERTITMGHKMFDTKDSRYYPGIIGGKTGYTSKAGNTLVTGVDKDGIRLITVIMKSTGTHYQDTKALLDYGFKNRDRLLAEAKQRESGNSAGGGSQFSGNSTPSGGASKGNSTAPSGPSSAGDADFPEGIRPQTNGWLREGSTWYYVKPDGSRAAGEWLELDGSEYWFDTNGARATGWRQFTNGDWYYFDENGIMVKGRWVQNAGKWFYLGKNGTMLKNTTTPDGYEVDGSGARK
ncbi:serine hydrolase [Lachnospiraceae bacterium 62-35]